MFITRISPYWRLSPMATSAYIPPVMSPATVRSISRLTARNAVRAPASPAQSRPGGRQRQASRRRARSVGRGAKPPSESSKSRLGEERGRGGPIGRPDDLELTLLPLAHDAGRGDVLAVLEADLADDGVELGARDVLAQGLAVEPDLLHRLLEDLQPRPRMRAGPAVGLLLELRDVGVEVGLGGGAGLGVPGADAGHALDRLAHALLVHGKGGAHRGVEHLGVEADLLGLAGDQEGVGRIGDADEGV